MQRSAASSISSAVFFRSGRSLQARDQRFGGAGDHGEHVVEVVGDAAGQLADGVELLRLQQLALGVAGAGDVVIDQRRAADGARRVTQRPAADDEMDRRVAAARADDDLHGVEFLAAQRARRRHVAGVQRGNAVGAKHRAQRPQQLDRHARTVAQHPFRGRVGEQHLAPGIDHEHRLGHAVKRALHDLGGMPQILMRLHQMLGPLGDRGFQRLVGGLAGGERFLQLPARPPGRQRQHDGQHQDQHHAGQIDRQQDAPVDLGLGAVEPPAAFAPRQRPFPGWSRSPPSRCVLRPWPSARQFRRGRRRSEVLPARWRAQSGGPPAPSFPPASGFRPGWS